MVNSVTLLLTCRNFILCHPCVVSCVCYIWCPLYSHECQSPVLFARSMISPESWGSCRLSIVGTVCACGSTGPTLALTLCQRLTSCADYGCAACRYTSPALVSTLDILCNLWLAQSWHTSCNARIVPEFDTGGGCWLVLTIVVASQTQNRWKLGILPCVLTTVSHWLALRLLQVAQQWKNSLTFV